MLRKLIGLFATLAIITVGASAKVQVHVYYESLCPDSQKFVTQQLYPTAKNELKDFLDIVWVPYGKSKTEFNNGIISFQCHHGPNECYGNLVHACAIERIEANSYEAGITKESLTLEYINCLMKESNNFPDSGYPGEKCANEVQLRNWKNIAECANSTRGTELLKVYGDMTQKLNITSVPTITFNSIYKPSEQDKITKHFRDSLCKYLPQPMPKVCTSGAGQLLSLAPLLAITTFIMSRIL